VKLKTSESGLYAFVKIKSAIYRININTGESTIVVDVRENLIYEFQIIFVPSMNEEVLVVSADRDEGIFLFAVNNCE